MQSPSILKPNSVPLFLDTSVLINLIAADCVENMRRALQRPLCVESYVAGELTRDPRTGEDGAAVLKGLVDREALEVVTMDDTQVAQFLNLVGAPSPDDLGDGEAATLACGKEHGFAAIDERKAQRIAKRDHADLTVYSTLDLLGCSQVISEWGMTRVGLSISHALEFGRMRVPHTWKSWVRNLVSEDTEKHR